MFASRTRAILSVTLVLLAGCAGIETASNGDEMRMHVVAEMNEVAKRVTKKELANCVERLEAEGPLSFGARYKVEGELMPSVFHSCLVQGWGATYYRAKPLGEAKAIAYAANLVKVAGAFGTGSARTQGYCAFRLKDGVISSLGAGTETRVNIHNQCPLTLN